MASRTSLRLRFLSRIPSRLSGTNGIKVTKDELDFVVSPDTPALVIVPALAALDTTFIQVYDEANDAYARISGRDLLAEIQDVILGPNLTGIDALSPAENRVPIFIDNDGNSTTYTVSEFVQTVSAATDSETFTNAIGAPQEADIGAFAIVKNRVDNERQVNDFSGATFTDKMIDALQNTMEDNLTLTVPDGINYLETLITLNGRTATRRVALRGQSPLSSRIRCQGGKLRINLTAWGQFEASKLWFDPVGEQTGDAPLYVEWNGMSGSRGFRIVDCQFGATNSEQTPTNWFENLLRLDGKGTGLISRNMFAGKLNSTLVTNGLQIDNCKEVDIVTNSFYHFNKAIFSNEGATSISEGIKVHDCTIVNVNHGIWLESAPTLPDMNVSLTHIAYKNTGIRLKNWSECKILDNLIYARSDSVETELNDIVLITCPSSIVRDNKFDAGPDRTVVNKKGLTIRGSSRNSRYYKNTFAHRTTAIILEDDGVNGVRDCEFAQNRAWTDLSGAKTVGTMVSISNSPLHGRNTWRGDDDEFSTIVTNSANQTGIAQNTWTTVVFGSTVENTPALALSAGTNPGEYVIKQNGTTRGRVKALVRLTTAASAIAGSIGLRLMRNNGSGFVEIERVSSGGADVCLSFTSSDYTFNAGNQFRLEIFQSAAGSATVLVGAKMEFTPIK